MRGILTSIIFVVLAKICMAQQLPQYTQWSYHQFAINPAHAGIKTCIDIHSLYRMQWLGFSGAPNSGFLSVGVPIDSKRPKYLSARHGTGFKFETDKLGGFNFNRLNFAYALHLNFNRDNRLSLGLYAGGVQMSYDPSNSTTIEPDPSVMNQANFLAPDASFGSWFNAENYYFGFMLRNLVPWKWRNIGDQSKYRFHSAFNAGYRFVLAEKFSILPCAIIRVPPKGPISTDLNLHFDYRNIIGLGVGYRNTDAIMFFLNLKIKSQFSVTYSFDYTLSSIQIGAKNTHELSLRFTTCKSQSNSTTGCSLFE